MENSKIRDYSQILSRQFADYRAVGLLFLAALWLQLFAALVPFWQHGTYYDYGWFIPPAAAWFAWRRWQSSGTPEAEDASQNWKQWSWLNVAIAVLILAALLLLFPLRIIEHNEVEWRFPRFIHFALVAGVSHVLIARLYSIRRSFNLLPVTIFCMMAMPLPYQLEQTLIQSGTNVLMAISEPI